MTVPRIRLRSFKCPAFESETKLQISFSALCEEGDVGGLFADFEQVSSVCLICEQRVFYSVSLKAIGRSQRLRI